MRGGDQYANQPRYPWADLVAAMGCSENQAIRQLGFSGSSVKIARTLGLVPKAADRLAVKAGLHPYEVWPQMADDAIAAVTVECRECGELFVPRRRDGVFCRPICNRRWWGRETKRRRRATPEGREENRRHRRAYYEANAEYERARERRRYRAKRARTNETTEAA